MDAVGPLQIRVLHFLWQHGPSTVLAVREHLNAENAARDLKPMAYTTVLTVMRNLARRRILTQSKDGRAHRFTPLVERQAYQRRMLRQTLQELFRDDARTMLGCLADEPAVDAELRTGLLALAKTSRPG